MVDRTNYEIINSNLVTSTEPQENNINPTYYYPVESKIQFYEKWKNVKVPEKTEVQHCKIISDWAYSSPYMGNAGELTEHDIYKQHKMGSYKFLDNYGLEKLENLEISEKNSEKSEKKRITRIITDEQIPFHKLSQDNPVIQFWDIPLYDDELNDNGLSAGSFRIRTMKDSFFGLLRSYLRVDNVMVRIIDSRIYHEFGTDTILRDFSVKESTYDTLKSKGFNLGSEWSLNHSQSDIVYPVLEVVMHLNDKLVIK